MRFREREGLPECWDEIAAATSGSFRRRWVELAGHRLPPPYRTFTLDDDSDDDSDDGGGLPGLAMVGGMMAEPTGHVRFDPHRVLSGGSATESVAEHGPHPWREVVTERAFPCLLVMFPGYETAPVGRWAHDPAAAAAFLVGLRGWATARGARSLAFLFLRDDHPEFLAALRDGGFAVTPMARRGDLDVAWRDFPEYVAGLPRNRRFSVRREVREVAARGIEIRERPLAAAEPELIGLRNQLVAKYGGVPDQEREVETMRLLRDRFGPDDVLVTEATKDGRPLAFALFVRDGDVWTSLMSGADYRSPDASFTYFSVMFYRPAALAPRLGITKIVYGLGSLDAKRFRGCTMTELHAAGALLDP